MQKPFAERSPLLFALLLWVGVMALYLLLGGFAQALSLPLVSQLLLTTVPVTLLGLMVLLRLGWAGEVGLTRLPPGRTWWLFLFPLLAALRPALDGFGGVAGLEQVGLIAAVALLTGFAEELIYRGLLLRALLPLGRWTAALSLALLFGLLHLLSLTAGVSPVAAGVQALSGAAVGLLFGALWIRGRSLWPLVGLHALRNFTDMAAHGLMGPAQPALLAEAVTLVILAAHGLWVLRTTPDEADAAYPRQVVPSAVRDRGM